MIHCHVNPVSKSNRSHPSIVCWRTQSAQSAQSEDGKAKHSISRMRPLWKTSFAKQNTVWHGRLSLLHQKREKRKAHVLTGVCMPCALVQVCLQVYHYTLYEAGHSFVLSSSALCLSLSRCCMSYRVTHIQQCNELRLQYETICKAQRCAVLISVQMWDVRCSYWAVQILQCKSQCKH